MLKEGEKVPGFNMENQNGEIVRLSDFKGRKILLYFYPKANTPGCTAQACSIRDSSTDLKAKNVAALGVSPDLPKAQSKFDDKYGLGFPLLSDPDHKVAEAYGVWGEKSLYGRKFMGIVRSSFLIDEEGKLVKAWYKVKPKDTVPNVMEEFEA